MLLTVLRGSHILSNSTSSASGQDRAKRAMELNSTYPAWLRRAWFSSTSRPWPQVIFPGNFHLVVLEFSPGHQARNEKPFRSKFRVRARTERPAQTRIRDTVSRYVLPRSWSRSWVVLYDTIIAAVRQASLFPGLP